MGSRINAQWITGPGVMRVVVRGPIRNKDPATVLHIGVTAGFVLMYISHPSSRPQDHHPASHLPRNQHPKSELKVCWSRDEAGRLETLSNNASLRALRSTAIKSESSYFGTARWIFTIYAPEEPQVVDITRSSIVPLSGAHAENDRTTLRYWLKLNTQPSKAVYGEFCPLRDSQMTSNVNFTSSSITSTILYVRLGLRTCTRSLQPDDRHPASLADSSRRSEHDVRR